MIIWSNGSRTNFGKKHEVISMKKRKTIILLLALLLLPALVYWLVWDGYGSGYSEEMRHLWNERQLAKEQESGFEIIELIESRMRHLQLSSAPEWSININVPPDLSSLPLSGMTDEELAYLANEKNDSEACLQLVQNILCTSFYHRYEERKKWLQKAIELKRPGADFLLNVLNELGVNKKTNDSESDDYIKKLPGYEDFYARVRSGDFMLYQTLIIIDHNFFDRDLVYELELCLDSQMNEGSLTAGKRVVNLYLMHALYDLYSEDNNSLWDRFLSRLPFDFGSSDNGSERIRKKYMKYCMEAAERGDLEAMHLFLSLSYLGNSPYDRKTWEACVKYMNCLIEFGFAHYVYWASRMETDNSSMWSFYYSADSIKHISAKVRNEPNRRGYVRSLFFGLWEDKWKTKTSHEKIEFIGKIKEVRPSILLTRVYAMDYLLYEEKDEDVRNAIICILRDLSGSGDMVAMSLLGCIYANGIVIDKDADLACRLLEGAWLLCREHNFMHTIDGEYGESMASIIVEKLMKLYMAKDLKTNNYQRAFELAQEFYSYRDKWACGVSLSRCYYMGYVHEHGIGTEINLDQAISFYREGLKNGEVRSIRALGSLYEQGRGVEKNLKTALQFYERALDQLYQGNDEEYNETNHCIDRVEKLMKDAEAIEPVAS